MALTRKQKKALDAARKDGKISGKEATSLSGLGIPKRYITQTKGGNVKVTNSATRKAGKAPATSSPTADRNTPLPNAVGAAAPSNSNQYGATQRQQNQAIQAARNDGYITNVEKKNLASLGIPKDKILDTRNGKVERVPSVPNIYKDASAVASRGINQVTGNLPEITLERAKRDGTITAAEAEGLYAKGYSRQDVRQDVIKDGVRINKGAEAYYDSVKKPASSGGGNGGNNGGGGNGGGMWNGLFNKKELRGLQEQVGMGITKYPEPDDDEEGTWPGREPGQIDYSGYNIGDWKKVAKELNIKSVDTPGDVNRLFAYVNNYESRFANGSGNNGNNNNGGSDGRYDRDSGEFDDIVGAIGEDINASNQRADDLNNMEVDTTNPNQNIIDDLEQSILDNTGKGNGRGNGRGNGNNGGLLPSGGAGTEGGGVVAPNPYQDLIDQLTLSNSDLYATTQGLIDDNAVLRSSFDDALEAQALESTNALAGLNDLFLESFNGIQGQIAQQQDDFNTAQAFSQQQLANANNLFLMEQQRSANLGNAYVPGANPNALSIAYGDNRNKKRQGQDNLLSDLTLMSGLGTQQNPLAGLQLA